MDEPYYHVGGCLALLGAILDGPRHSDPRDRHPLAFDAPRRRAWIRANLPRTAAIWELAGRMP